MGLRQSVGGGRWAVAVLVACAMAGCDRCPPSSGSGTPPATDAGSAAEVQARALFQNYTADTHPQTSYHTSRVCDVVAVRIDFTPPLAPGTQAHIKLENAAGGATAELGQTPSHLQEFDQNATADGSLGFGFHFMSGPPGTGSIDIVIEAQGRPPQRIHVKVIT